jgi:hypothetical protein
MLYLVCYATVPALRPIVRRSRGRCYSVTSATTVIESGPLCLCVVSHRLSSFLIRFKFCFLRWFASGDWIFSKHLCHLLTQVFKVGHLPLFCRGGGFLLVCSAIFFLLFARRCSYVSFLECHAVFLGDI